MRRREFLGLAGGVALAWPAAVRAQQSATRTIGWLSLRSASTSTEKTILAAFRQGLNQTGFVEGRNLTIEYRFGDGHIDRLPALAADLVRRQVEVLATGGGVAVARAAHAATTTIPIIFSTASDPVLDGFVKSLNRPDGNSTGTYVLNNALLPKRLEVLRQLVPNARLVGFLVNPDTPSANSQIRLVQSATRSMGLELLVISATTAEEIDAAFVGLVRRNADGLVMGSDLFFQIRQGQVIALAARHRLPTIYEWPEFVRAGGLASYSADRLEMRRQMGVYVSRVLNGAKPRELPVMQPTKFDLVVNLKTAKSLGLKISESFQQLIDEVIE